MRYITKITKLTVQSIDSKINQNFLVQVVLKVDVVHQEIDLCAEFLISLFLINYNPNPVLQIYMAINMNTRGVWKVQIQCIWGQSQSW